MTIAQTTAHLERGDVARILGRPFWEPKIDSPISTLAQTNRVAVTGASGSLGEALSELKLPCVVSLSDINTVDVRDRAQVSGEFHTWRPDVVFHLAGAKHAPEGELNPTEVTQTNAVGTLNVVGEAAKIGAKVVLASTCKACDPETAYGASKLLAERIVLQAGGSVARFFNVVETSGNVFETWGTLPEDQPLPVTPCERYFISLDEAVALLLWTAVLPAGRYAVDPVRRRKMTDVAASLYPGRATTVIPPRQGDRVYEPLRAASESFVDTGMDWLMRVTSPHESVL